MGEAKAKTRGEKVQADVAALLKSRHTLLWVVTREEYRVEKALTEAAAAAKYQTRMWDCVQGFTDAQGKPVSQEAADPMVAFQRIREGGDSAVPKCLFVMRDLHRFAAAPDVQRALRNLARSLQSVPAGKERAVAVLTPSSDVPLELAGHVTVIDWPLPDRAEVEAIFDGVGRQMPAAKAKDDAERDACVDAAVGLTSDEVMNCYTKSLAASGRVDHALVAAEKRRVISREKVLTWHDPDPRGLDAVGGLDVLKGWLRRRRAAFTQAARAFGLPPPKGALLCGLPGTGKSLTAKAVAAAWGVPLLRLDMGALKSKFVGESEANIRRALSVAEAVSPCVLWLDEIEKALAGSTGPQGDGGVAADALGYVLSWMQERQGAAFVFATANDVSSLPPELLRKGRFDELFWLDLPTRTERMEIAAAALRAHGRDPKDFDLDALADASPGFVGAEIAAAVPDALFVAFEEGQRALTTEDVVAALREVVPLSKTAKRRVEDLRAWGSDNARLASLPEAAPSAGMRAVDLS